MVINCVMNLWCTKTSINKGLGEGCNTHFSEFSLIFAFSLAYVLSKRVINFLLKLPKFIVHLSTLLLCDIPSTKAILSCLYLVMNFQVQTQVPL